MRKSREEAAATRERIVDAAAREFRQNGIAETGLSDLMAAAGLTHGGFYKHFESKDQIVAEACAEAVGSLTEMMTAVASDKPSRGGFEALVAKYLSTAHRDEPSHGCPLAALGSEIARCDEKTRAAATDGFLRLVDIIGRQFGRTTPDAVRRRALAVASTMIGALTMARIATDPELSAEILHEVGKYLTLK